MKGFFPSFEYWRRGWRVVRKVFLISVLSIPCATVWGHDDGKSHGSQPRYEGNGFRKGERDEPPLAFTSQGVNLEAWISLPEFDQAVGVTVSGGADLWGYVSSSGREYALSTFQNGVAFIDITVPSQPNIVAGFSGPLTTWRDVKTFGHYAYVVADDAQPNDARNIEVFDLSQIDLGVVTRVNTIDTQRSHNVAIDTDSGYLYRTGSAGGDGRGLVVYDLNADAVNPPEVGEWDERYFHDAQVVTFQDGPNAGRQIAFGFAEDNSSGGNAGLDIIDVTDKANMFRVGRVLYSNNEYSHQGWLSPDRRYVYLNDELDETRNNQITTTTTRILDVSDLSAPFEAGTFTNGNSAVDHNLYTRFNLIFEANYRSGLRVFDATDPLNPVEVGFFDTYPDDDHAEFNGLWSNYPYFPSRTVIGSDIEKGLFIWKVDALSDVLMGDGNYDGAVDELDLELWTAGRGTFGDGHPGNGDFDEDGDVDGFDFLIWQSRFQGEIGVNGSINVTVPEPASLFWICICAFVTWRRC